MRLDKFLANSGIGSRSKVKDLIKNKKILVNDIIIINPEFKVNIDNDIVKLGENIINYSKFKYIMLNKPKGYISATDDVKHKTVLDLIKGYDTYKLFPVGRLDIDTEGLLLLTNDGNLAHKLLSPKKNIKKVYYVELLNNISLNDIYRVENEIILEDGYKCKKAKINSLDNNKLTIEITEGKFHQVKRMFLAVNNKVIYLKRIKIHNLELDLNLKLGEYRELNNLEMEGLNI